MNIHLMPNLDKPQALECALKVANLLHKANCGINSLKPEQAQLGLDFVQMYETRDECVRNCDVIVAVGGDGTIIHAAKHALD